LPEGERLHGFGSSYGQTISSAVELSSAALQETEKMTESRHPRSDNDNRDKPVREQIEAERERDKRKEDEVATSSDDSFPASDPPSFTGVTSAADVERKRKKVNGVRT
jgi:hypothetical protein